MARPLHARVWFSAAASAVLLAACATGPQVKTQADPSADFGQYNTWGFYKPIAMESSGYSSWITERISSDVRQQMDARGYRYAETNPDLLVNFQLQRGIAYSSMLGGQPFAERLPVQTARTPAPESERSGA